MIVSRFSLAKDPNHSEKRGWTMMTHFLAAKRDVSRQCSLVVLMSLAAVAGCGTDENLPPTVPVTGKVIYQGKPVKDATVMFFPSDNVEGNPAIAKTADEGVYQLTTYEFGDGAVPGKHTVTVQLFNAPITLPVKYGSRETTPLEFTVEPEQENHFDIVLEE